MNVFKNKKMVIFLSIFACILWGSAFPVLKTSYIELKMLPTDLYAKVAFAGIRFILAGIILFLISVFVLKINVKLNFKEFKSLLILGVFNTALAYFFFYNGLANTSGIKAAILQSTSTFLVVIASHFVYHNDKLSKKKVIGLILGFIGIIAVNIESGFGDFSFKLMGEGFMIFAAISSSIGVLLAKKLGQKCHPFKVAMWQMIFGAIILLVVGFSNVPLDYFVFTNKAKYLLIYASVLSAIAFSLWFTLLKYNKAGEIAMYRFVIPISGAILSALFLKEEKFSISILLGLLCVSAGLFILNMKNGKSYTK